MARTTPRPAATLSETLLPLTATCPGCGGPLWLDYYNRRTVTTRRTVPPRQGVVRLRPGARRCHRPGCPRYLAPFRPEAEGRVGLPRHEFGLDVLALIGALRHAQHRGVPEIHAELTRRGVALAQRTVSNRLDRYDELRALAACDPERLKPALAKQGKLILAIDGLQPDVGHGVLWVIRDCLSGTVLLAKSPLSSARADLADLPREVTGPLGLGVAGVVSDGQRSIRNAVAEALPGVPHQLCHFHFLREAGTPIYEMDRHAKRELKKTVRGVRPIERQAEGQDDPAAELLRGYCAAVRGALTDDGRPP